MQYYRLWIYSCNVVLAFTSTIFIIFAAFVVADFRLTLLQGVELYHPTFFYAYGALILQCGVVQTIGCLGAQRLSHKLLSLYWTLLLLLTLGDVGVGLYWVFHLEKVKDNLRPFLSSEFIAKYSTDESFTLTWNKVQSQDHCCGVNGPFDFEKFPSPRNSKQAAFTANSHVIVDVETGLLSLPESCCTLLYAPATVSSSSSGGASLDKTYRVSHYPSEEEYPPFSDQPPESSFSNNEHSSLNPTDFTSGRGGGGGRRSRTAISLPHKNDDPRITNEQTDIKRQPPASYTQAAGKEDSINDDSVMDDSDEHFDDSWEDDYSYDKKFHRNSNYLGDFHQSDESSVVPAAVPDDYHNNNAKHTYSKPNHPPAALPADSLFRAQVHEPSHPHKVRHELHRKSQSLSSVDDKPPKHSTSSPFIAKHNNVTNGLLFREHIVDNNRAHKSSKESSETGGLYNSDSNYYENTVAQKTRNRVEGHKNVLHLDNEETQNVSSAEDVVQQHTTRQTLNKKTNKLFPSISFRVKRDPSETRALLFSSSVTQVAGLSRAPTIQRTLGCHGQPEGLNHQISDKKDLLDQRETRKKEQRYRSDAKTSTPNAENSGAAWLYRGKTRTSEATRGPEPTSFFSASYPTPNPSISAEITNSLKAQEIAKLNDKEHRATHKSSSQDQPGFLPNVRNPPGQNSITRMTYSMEHTASKDKLDEFKLSHLLSAAGFHQKRTNIRPTTLEAPEADARGLEILHKYERNSELREKRNAEISAHSSHESSQYQLPTVPLASTKSTRLTFKGKLAEGQGREEIPTSFSESHFHPLPSNKDGVYHSSTSYMAARSAYAAVVSASSTPYEHGNESSNDTSDGEKGSDENSDGPEETSSGSNSTKAPQKQLYVYGVGCGVKLIEWVDHVSGILFILGFCIIGFAKVSFLFILRTEIREMIEKINMIEPDEVISPTRAPTKEAPKFHRVSHPLLQNPHRASTVSAHGAMLPTIKSPDGPPLGIAPLGPGGYTRPNRHYLRRASNIVGGDRSRSHSNETVNMSLLMTASQIVGQEKGRSNPNLTHSAGGSCGTITNIEEKDPVSGLSITVPNSSSSCGVGTSSSSAAIGTARYLRRSSTCSSSTNPMGYPYGYGFDGFEPRPGPSSRFYQYFEPIYQTPHLYQQHHHHHYTRNRSHSRNMSCGAILPLASYRTNSAAAAASAALAASYRGARNLSSATNTATTTSIMPNSTGCSFSSTSKDETEMIISVSLEHIVSSDQDEGIGVAEKPELPTPLVASVVDEESEDQEDEQEDEKDQELRNWAASTSCIDDKDKVKSTSKVEDSNGTKLQTFSHSESANQTGTSGSTTGSGSGAERDLQRRNGNNNVDLSNGLPMSYIGTAV